MCSTANLTPSNSSSDKFRMYLAFNRLDSTDIKNATQHRIKLIASCFLFGNLLRDSFVLLIFKVNI